MEQMESVSLRPVGSFSDGGGRGQVNWLAQEQGVLLMVAIRRPHELTTSLTWFQGLLIQCELEVLIDVDTHP